MLIITRRTLEEFVINDNITIKIFDVRGNQVKIGIDAPKDVSIMRSELINRLKLNEENKRGNEEGPHGDS